MADKIIQPGTAPANPALHKSPSLRTAIGAALKRHGIPPTRFGRDAVRDPRFVLDIMRYDREPRPKTEARVRAYIASLDGEVVHA